MSLGGVCPGEIESHTPGGVPVASLGVLLRDNTPIWGTNLKLFPPVLRI